MEVEKQKKRRRRSRYRTKEKKDGKIIKKVVKDDYKEEYRKIPRVKEYKYLGIILDEKLDFKKHWENISNKI
jgi:hypothetical protein